MFRQVLYQVQQCYIDCGCASVWSAAASGLQGPDYLEKTVNTLVIFITEKCESWVNASNQRLHPLACLQNVASVCGVNPLLLRSHEKQLFFSVVSWLWFTAQRWWFPAVFPKGPDDCTPVSVLFFTACLWEGQSKKVCGCKEQVCL